MAEPTLSLCMIVRDEEGWLPACLESVRPIVDEMVVVDTGSTDRTAAVAEARGARVFHHPWSDDFSEARNVSLARATGDWILVLDADEVIAPQDLPRLRALLKSDQSCAFSFVTRNYSAQSEVTGWRPCAGEYAEEAGHPGWFPSKKVRLFPRHPDVRFAGRIHELVEPSLARLGCPIVEATVPVHHSGNAGAHRDLRAKGTRYLALAEQKAREEGSVKALYEYALLCAGAGQYTRAAELLRELHRRAPEQIGILSHLGACLVEMGEGAEGLKLLQQATRRRPRDPILQNNLGAAYERLGHRRQAREAFRKAVRLDPSYVAAQQNLGMVALALGRTDEAKRALERALTLTPAQPELRRLVEQLRARGKKPVTLSVCMIVRNEERNLADCLEPLRRMVDEIIVVDTGSTDRTVEKARALGAAVHHFPWCDDFAAARNESLRHATGDYILWLDADDRMAPEEVGKLGTLKAMLPVTQDEAYQLLLRLPRGGVDDEICYQLRLFPNRPGVAFEGRIHEQVAPCLVRLQVRQGRADIEIVHRGYGDPKTDRQKAERNLRLLLLEDEARPGNAVIHYRLADTLGVMGEPEKAARFLEAALEEAASGEPPAWMESAVFKLGSLYQRLGAPAEAEARYRRCLEQRPESGLVRLCLAECLLMQGRGAEALEELGRIRAETLTGGMTPLPLGRLHFLLAFHRAVCCEQLGRVDEAAAAFRDALGMDPGHPEAQRRLGLMLARSGRVEEALPVLEALKGAGATDPVLCAQLGNLYLARGEAARAADVFQHALQAVAAKAPAPGGGEHP